MKKIFAIMILLAGVMTFTSCGDDLDDASSDEQLIVGKWELDEEVVDQYDIGRVVHVTSTLEFKKNGKYSFEGRKQTYFYGKKIYDDTEKDEGKYSVDEYNEQVAFKSSKDYTYGGEYKSISKSKLYIRIDRFEIFDEFDYAVYSRK